MLPRIMFGDPTFADVILDCLVHNAYKLKLIGGSMRKKESSIDQSRSLNGIIEPRVASLRQMIGSAPESVTGFAGIGSYLSVMSQRRAISRASARKSR